jgi:hypothetical protein
VRYRSLVSFFYMCVSSFPTPFFEKPVLSSQCVSVCSIDLSLLFMSMPCCFDYCNSIIFF